MVELKKVVIQDSIPLMEAFPDHFLWTHPVFSTSEYRAYRDLAKGTMEKDNTPGISFYGSVCREMSGTQVFAFIYCKDLVQRRLKARRVI